MQIGDWGNVLIRHVCEWKHRKYSPWACLFSGVEFCGAFHFQKIIFLQLLQIWSSYCFHCDTDQLWTHTQSNNKTKCFKRILLTVKNPTPHLCTFWHQVIYIYIYKISNKLDSDWGTKWFLVYWHNSNTVMTVAVYWHNTNNATVAV